MSFSKISYQEKKIQSEQIRRYTLYEINPFTNKEKTEQTN